MGETPLNLSSLIPEGWRGKLPPCLIQVNAQGELSHYGAPLIHPGILELIFQSVHLEDGVYVLRVGQQACELEVEDTFFVVCRAEVAGGQAFVTLNDGSREELDPAGLWIGDGDVLYCRVKSGAFPARFQRQAYYQLAAHIEEEGEGFALTLGGARHPLATAPKNP